MVNELNTNRPFLSVVIPAYNEAARIGATLDAVADYLSRQTYDYEVLVVSDGSTDATADICRSFCSTHPSVSFIELPNNRGKGFAVRKGVLESKGTWAIYLDADGSAPISEVERLLVHAESGFEVIFGSRAMGGEGIRLSTVRHRMVMGRIFNFLVNLIVLPGVKDTQCGFKMFSRQAADRIFPKQTSERFSFDVELLLIARLMGIPSKEVGINWTNAPGSKVHLVRDSLRMLRDTIRFRLKALRGDYRDALRH